MEKQAPKIDKRNFDGLLEDFSASIPSGPPGSKPFETGVGLGLRKIFCRMMETLVQRLNRVPEKHFAAFLDTIGVSLLPPQAALVPITFFLSEGTGEHVLVPEKTQVAAGDIIFETQKSIFATPAKLTALYRVVPAGDRIIDHSAELAENKSINMSGGDNLQEHILYLGHKDLFNITGPSTITINIGNGFTGSPDVSWEYFGENSDGVEDWHTLDISSNGNPVVLTKSGEGEIKEHEINGIKSRWIRCKATAIEKVKGIKLDTIRIIDVKGAIVNELPVGSIKGVTREFAERLSDNGVNTVANLLTYSGMELATILAGDGNVSEYEEIAKKILENAGKLKDEESLPDMAFYNDVPLDIKRMSSEHPIYPFGRIPKMFAAFYIASQEAFSKKNYTITINFYLCKCEAITDGIVLSWEYWDGNGWKCIENLTDNTNKFTASDSAGNTVEFTCPPDIEKIEVAGHENYWIRVRIAGGDYGKELYIENENDSGKIIYVDESHPPKIKDIEINYVSNGNPDVESSMESLSSYVFIYNNLQFEDVSEECNIVDSSIEPFQIIDDEHCSLYLGFDKKLEKGPISIFFSIDEEKQKQAGTGHMPKIRWYCPTTDPDNPWERLETVDNTQNLTCSGTVEFLLPPGFINTKKFGKEMYWLKAVVKENNIDKFPLIENIHVNTVFALQAESVENEILGSGTGTGGKKFQTRKAPVMDETVWIDETGFLTDEEKEFIIKENGEDFISEIKDETGKTTQIWVRWQPKQDFLGSSAKDRHYVMDGASGEITFGSGVQGKIPPRGKDNIKISYRIGGGQQGNVKADEITTIKTSLPFVDTITNKQPAQGGSDTEQLSGVFERGPHLIKHRNRAVTMEDFQRLALEASVYVARSQCIEQDNKLKIIIIPKDVTDKPTPSPTLLKTVEKYILQRSLNTILPGSIEVLPPEYIEISVTVDVVPTSIDIAVPLEKEILTRLKQFFHPLTGGPGKNGWESGRDVHISDIYAMLESIEGVDHTANLLLNNNDVDMEVGKSETVCSGTHDITMKFGG